MTHGAKALAGYAVCVGAAKAGTTTLYALMSRHPEVATSVVKETDFYYEDRYYAMGFDRYIKRYFRPHFKTRLLFEADPVYMYGRGCMERLRNCAPNVRVIVMLRNPVDRAFSQYQYRMTYRRYDESFEDMCEREFTRIAQGDEQRMEYGCLDRSRYAAQISEILRYFPREQVYFIVFEEFVRDQRGVFARLQRWLGLTELDVGEAKENPGGEARSVVLARLLYHARYRWARALVGRLLFFATARRRVYALLGRLNLRERNPEAKFRLDPELRKRLLREFEQDVAAVEQLTGLDLAVWRNG
jgi:hypothetical protein